MKRSSVIRNLFGAAAALLLAACNANGGSQPGVGGGGTQRAAVVSFVATPATVLSGGTSTLSWTTSDATACTASGQWSGAKDTAGSEVVTPPTATGSYTYVLSCTGPGGANAPSSVTVTVGTQGAATITSFKATPATVLPGESSTLSWDTTGATSCTASGAWSGTKSTSGSEVVTPPSTPGSYLYTLTCTGPGGTNSASSITVTVAGPASGGGSIPPATTDISGWTCTNRPSGTATGATSGLLCQVVGAISPCVVTSPEKVVDGNDQTFAVVDFPLAALGPLVVDVLGLNGTATITVDLPDTVAAGGVAAFDVTFPGSVVEAAVLQDINVNTFQDDAASESQNKGQTLNLLGLLGPTGHVLVGFVNQKPYNRLQIQFSATGANADVLDDVAHVFDACTAAHAP